MIPIMSDVVQYFETDISLDTYERQSVDFVLQMVKVSSEQKRAVVQPANRDKVLAVQSDMTLRHITVHATYDIRVGQYVVFRGVDYKVITPGDYDLYGFSEVVAAEVKGAIT